MVIAAGSAAARRCSAVGYSPARDVRAGLQDTGAMLGGWEVGPLLSERGVISRVFSMVVGQDGSAGNELPLVVKALRPQHWRDRAVRAAFLAEFDVLHR